MNRARLAACALLLVLVPEANAHFALTRPTAYSVQASDGSPQKSAPCGQSDPGSPMTPTHAVTSYHEGDTVTVTIEEKVFHRGHYRVALADDPSKLPADPPVLADADSACGTVMIQDPSTAGVIVDNMLPHTTAFSGAQSFQFTLPAGKTCTNCTLQVIEFMSNHGLNNPGGCFYHHCARVSITNGGVDAPPAAPDVTPVADAPAGCCDVRGNKPNLAIAAIVLLALGRRRRRR